MSAESNNVFAAAKAASHVRFFLTQAEDGNRPECYGAAGLVDNPDARPVAPVGDRRIGEPPASQPYSALAAGSSLWPPGVRPRFFLQGRSELRRFGLRGRRNRRAAASEPARS